MIKSLSNLIGRANGVKNEVLSLANTALRIGLLILDAIRSGTSRFDPAATYVQGQYAIIDGVLCEVLIDTLAGETPSTHPLKWSVKLVLNASQANESNNLPIAASAVVALIAAAELSGDGAPNADTTKRGIVRQSTDPEFNSGTNNDTFVTPKQVKSLSVAIFQAVANLAARTLLNVVNNASDADKSAALLAMLNAADAPTIAKICQIAQACGALQPPIVEWVIDGYYEEADGEAPDLTILISRADFVASSTGIYRIVGPASISEGTAGQYAVEEQLTDGTWVHVDASLAWSLVGPPSGVNISTTGLLTVGADTLTANVTIAIHASVADSVVEFSVILSNTAPTVTGYRISGPSTLNEGSTSAYYYVLIDYSDGSTLVYVGSGTWSLPSDTTNTVVNDSTHYSTTLTSPPNAVSANTNFTLQFTSTATGTINKTVGVVDTPCTTHPMLTTDQFNAYPRVFIYEYTDLAVPYGGLDHTVRAFFTRSEAIAHLSDRSGSSKAHFDYNSVTTSVCAVGDVLYNDNRAEHVLANTNFYYPVEAGWWGFDWDLPTDGSVGSVVLIQTNACGEIITRETYIIPATIAP